MKFLPKNGEKYKFCENRGMLQIWSKWLKKLIENFFDKTQILLKGEL